MPAIYGPGVFKLWAKCRQTTVSCIVSAGVTVSVGVAPILRATRSERTFAGEISETSMSIGRHSYAQSRMAAAAS